MTTHVLDRLTALIAARHTAEADASYTRQLLDGGPRRCAKKLGEEAAEAIIAALVEDDVALANEAADVVYHLLVLLEVRKVPLSQVFDILEARMAKSGIAEKAQRSAPAGKGS